MEEHPEEKKPSAPSQSKQIMEREIIPAGKIARSRPERQEVITIRTWKEYLGESLLIIFSVVLALGLTEWFSKLHEEKQTRQVLRQLRDEVVSNKRKEEEQYRYHLRVLKNIDSALTHPAFAKQFMNNDMVYLYETIAPEGVLFSDLDNIAWEIAKQDNVFAKIDFDTYSLLTDIYNNQQRIPKAEDEIGKVLLSWESRKPENLRTTLILVRDNYMAWAVGRAPALLKKYERVIDRLKDY